MLRSIMLSRSYPLISRPLGKPTFLSSLLALALSSLSRMRFSSVQTVFGIALSSIAWLAKPVMSPTNHKCLMTSLLMFPQRLMAFCLLLQHPTVKLHSQHPLWTKMWPLTMTILALCYPTIIPIMSRLLPPIVKKLLFSLLWIRSLLRTALPKPNPSKSQNPMTLHLWLPTRGHLEMTLTSTSTIRCCMETLLMRQQRLRIPIPSSTRQTLLARQHLPVRRPTLHHCELVSLLCCKTSLAKLQLLLKDKLPSLLDSRLKCLSVNKRLPLPLVGMLILSAPQAKIALTLSALRRTRNSVLPLKNWVILLLPILNSVSMPLTLLEWEGISNKMSPRVSTSGMHLASSKTTVPTMLLLQLRKSDVSLLWTLLVKQPTWLPTRLLLQLVRLRASWDLLLRQFNQQLPFNLWVLQLSPWFRLQWPLHQRPLPQLLLL